jgi:hypothetical protein
MNNVIVLTIGWTGSSVLSALLARAGLWAGDATMKKVDYNTWENLELTELNKKLLVDSGCPIDYARDFSWAAIARVTSAFDRLDTTPYRAFAAKMKTHAPWVWKDPRLWVTIRFWQRLMSFDDVRFVWLTRDDMQSWISANIRRQIITWAYCKRYNSQVNNSIEAFLELGRLPSTRLSFEDIVERPEATLDQLNRFLSTSLTMEDLKGVYTKPLHRRARGKRDLLLASVIHAKNYAERIDGASPEAPGAPA